MCIYIYIYIYIFKGSTSMFWILYAYLNVSHIYIVKIWFDSAIS